MPLIETAGAASSKGFGEFSQKAAAVKYIEQFFSTWLRTGTGASATVTTNLDASTNKALVWTKSRSAATDHKLTDTVRGATKALISDTTGAQTTDTNGLTAFSSTGYTIGTDTNYNNNGATYVDWEFVATPKFFDIVTYTGDGVAGRTVAHNLGSVPGCIIVKCTSNSSTIWYVWHRSLPSGYLLQLDSTNAQDIFGANFFGNGSVVVDPTLTVFTLGANTGVNNNSYTYVAYLFAHDAGGFGLSGTDNVISCGSFTTDGSGNATVNLGYEPQWFLMKASSTTENWNVLDNMRGFGAGTNVAWPYLRPNTSDSELTSAGLGVTATGFQIASFGASTTYIYIAIRRGPMATPTSGTSVFGAYASSGASPDVSTVTRNYDLAFSKGRGDATYGFQWIDRLRGLKLWTVFPNNPELVSSSTNAESTSLPYPSGLYDSSGGIYVTVPGGALGKYFALFRRAPGFFDEVCYTGTGSARTLNHNLGVVPELMIVKGRSGPNGLYDWPVYSATLGATKYLWLNTTDAQNTFTPMWNDTAPTASVFTVGTGTETNQNTATYVAYLFATVAGVSKVGSYTGTGSTLQIDCGFTGGARFVLIKATSTTGDWYVWDSARGIVAGDDPYLLLNSTAAEVTNTDYVDTYSAGFEISSTAPAAINANGGSFIFLAVA